MRTAFRSGTFVSRRYVRPPSAHTRTLLATGCQSPTLSPRSMRRKCGPWPQAAGWPLTVVVRTTRTILSISTSVPSSYRLNRTRSRWWGSRHVKTTSAPATPDWDLIRKGTYTSVGGEFKMEYQPSGQASCGFNGSANYSELTAGPALNDGKWHTVQCVKTASAIKVVVDGQTFSKAATIGSIANTDPVVIGAHPGSEFFTGSLDEASIQVG